MRNLLFYSLVLLICLLINSCSLSSESPEAEVEDLEIMLPAWPPESQSAASLNYPPLSRWQVRVTSAEAQTSYLTSSAKISISIKKNRPFCITAQALTLLQDGKECEYFKPAGYLYTSATPYSATWEQGYTASIMETLFFQGIDEGLSPLDIEVLISTFNWKKAQETIDKKLTADNQLYYNPWLIPQSQVLEGITNHSFKASLLNNSACAALPADSLPQGFLSSFIPENFSLLRKNQFTVRKNSPIIIGDGRKYGFFVTYKSAKNISLEPVFLPIFIEDI